MRHGIFAAAVMLEAVFAAPGRLRVTGFLGHFFFFPFAALRPSLKPIATACF
jgi:hypothetical protein